jgi:hypothetical protein
MRDEAPVYHNEELDFFALTRFDDCIDAFRDWESPKRIASRFVPGPMIFFIGIPAVRM